MAIRAGIFLHRGGKVGLQSIELNSHQGKIVDAKEATGFQKLTSFSCGWTQRRQVISLDYGQHC